MARSDSVTSSHTLFGYPVVNNSLSRSYNIQVKNAVALKVRNSCLSIESVSARICNFGHSSTLYIAFSAYYHDEICEALKESDTS